MKRPGQAAPWFTRLSVPQPGSLSPSDVTLVQVTALSANISHAWLQPSPHILQSAVHTTKSEEHSQPLDSVSLAGAGHLLDPGPDLGSFASPWPGLNMTRTRVTDDQHPD